MHLMPSFTRLAAVGVVFLAGCWGETAPLAPKANDVALRAPSLRQQARLSNAALKTPALIASDLATGALLYWPTQERQRRHDPIEFARSLGAYQSSAMAANGDLLVIAIWGGPGELLKYDVETKQTSTLTDDYGAPYDVAIDKKGNIYALNVGSITVYPAGSGLQKELLCDYSPLGQTIALDNEGDVFVNAVLNGSAIAVLEYPVNGRKCKILKLQPELGYAGGVGVDPTTDDLIVIDNPGVCAGLEEGRMTIYPKPYSSTKFTQVNLHAQLCGASFRLDGDSRHIYLSDQSDEYGPIIDVRTYPAGAGYGFFSRRQFGYAVLGGFTTIPNELPN